MLSGGCYFDDTLVSDVSRIIKLIKTLLKGIILHFVLARNFRFVQLKLDKWSNVFVASSKETSHRLS